MKFSHLYHNPLTCVDCELTKPYRCIPNLLNVQIGRIVFCVNLRRGAFKRNMSVQCQCCSTGGGAFIEAGAFIRAFTVL